MHTYLWCRPVCLLRFVLLLVPSAAHAEFYDRPFELRLFLSVDRQSNYSSTLARQASMAALDGGSANPGAAAWREPVEPLTTVTASFVDAPSTGGRRVVAAPVTIRWQAQGTGTIALAYAHTDTRNPQGNDGMQQSLRSDEWIGGYGRRIGDHAAVGFTVRLTSGKIVSDAISPAVGDQPVRKSTSFLSPDASVGYVVDVGGGPATLGFAAGYGRARADTSITTLTPLVISLPPIAAPIVLPPSTLLDESRDDISTFTLRAGAGFHLNDATAIYVDTSGLHVSTRHSGSLNLVRFALGAEHAASQGFILRGGVGVDTIGKVNWSCGFGYRLNRSFEAQLAFQTNAAPEVNREIGRTRLLAGSLAWVF